MKNDKIPLRPMIASSYLDYKIEQKRRYDGDDPLPGGEEAAFRTWAESGEAERRIEESMSALRKLEAAISGRKKDHSGSRVYRLQRYLLSKLGKGQSEANLDELVFGLRFVIRQLSHVKQYLAFLEHYPHG
jgi:hypothetical protein